MEIIVKIVLYILLIVIVYIGAGAGIFYYKLEHAPQLPDIDQSDKILGSGPVLRYIAAGDSTAVGEGASSLSTTYTYQVAEFLSGTHTVKYKNIGVKGAQTKNILNDQVPQIIAYRPDIVTISMGANDATHLVSKNQILQNYKAIIGQLERQTSATIYITNIPNFNGSSLLPRLYIALLEYRSENLNTQILALGSDRVKILDIHDFGWSQFPNRKITYAADGFHPNDIGYKNWAQAFLAQIAK